ncbi:hypothetical protein [Methylomonas sp. MgM2]
MDRQTIEQILNTAIRAPSGDNVQPWRFEITNNCTQVKLYNLPERDNSYYNYRQAASYISHGALIENLIIASKHYGYKSSIDLFPDESNPDFVARIIFHSDDVEIDPLYDAIFNRTTNRFHYQNHQVSGEELQSIIDSISKIKGINAYFIHEPRIIKKLAIALIPNDRLVFERRDIHRFLFSQIRWNQKEIDESKDGMPIDTLGLNGLEKAFFPMLRFWWFVNFANFFGLSRAIGLKSWYNCQNAGVIGQITSLKTDRVDFVQAGRTLQRIWLESTLQGFAFQPIIGLQLLFYRASIDALTELSPKHQKMVTGAEKLLRKLFGIQNNEYLIVGFRIGKADTLRTKTLRKPPITSPE